MRVYFPWMPACMRLKVTGAYNIQVNIVCAPSDDLVISTNVYDENTPFLLFSMHYLINLQITPFTGMKFVYSNIHLQSYRIS